MSVCSCIVSEVLIGRPRVDVLRADWSVPDGPIASPESKSFISRAILLLPAKPDKFNDCSEAHVFNEDRELTTEFVP